MDDAETCVLCGCLGTYENDDDWKPDANGLCAWCARDFGLDWPTDEATEQ